jgi:hypothetical protein
MRRDEVEGKALAQAREIAESLKTTVTLPGKPDLGGEALVMELEKKQVIALIAYVQKLGAYREVGDGTRKPILLDPDTQRRAAMPMPAPKTSSN